VFILLEENHYLEHIIFKERITIDLDNIEVIVTWPTPKNVSKTSWLLLAITKMFIEIFSKIAHIITFFIE
jgi:hypothetical protein